MEDQVQFKVHCYWDTNDHEIRRFGVDKSMVTSFHYLNAKLQETFTNLKNRTYHVDWKDQEGDNVTVSSDNEMLTMLNYLNEDVVKLHIYCTDGVDFEKSKAAWLPEMLFSAAPGPGSGDAKDAIHLGVVCDGCDSQVRGFRYKCSTCDDYDLCSKCEAEGLHPEHFMIRVPSPALPRAVIRAAIKRSRHFLKTVTNVAGEECPYKRNKREKSGDRKHHGDQKHHRRQRGSWFETFATYMNEFANLAGDLDIDTPRGQDTQPQKPQATPDQPQATADQPQATPDQPQASQEQKKEAPKPAESGTGSDRPTGCPFSGSKIPQSHLQFQSYIDQVQKMIDASKNAEGGPRVPYAVEQLRKLFEMYMMDSGMQTANQPKPSTSASNDASVNTNNVDTNNASVNTGDVEMANPEKTSEAEKLISLDDRASMRSEAGSVSSASSKRDESPDKGDDWTMINNEKDLMDAYMKQGGTEQPPAPGFNLSEQFDQRVKISEGQSLYPPLNTATAVAEMPQPSAPMQPQPRPQPAQAPPQPAQARPQPAQAPPKPAPQPQPLHPQAHIAAAIEHMLAMGFTNDGGWLTQLLENKDGNIAAVLDLLTPVSPKK